MMTQAEAAQKILELINKSLPLEAAGKVFSSKNTEAFKGLVSSIWNRNEEIERLILDYITNFVAAGSMTVEEADAVTNGEYSEEMAEKTEVEASLRTDFEAQLAQIRLNAIFRSFELSTDFCCRLNDEVISEFCSALRNFFSEGQSLQKRDGWPCFSIEVGGMAVSLDLPFKKLLNRQAWVNSLNAAMNGFCLRLRSVVYSPDDVLKEQFGDRSRQEVGLELVNDFESILKELARTNPYAPMMECAVEPEETKEAEEAEEVAAAIAEEAEEVKEEAPVVEPELVHNEIQAESEGISSIEEMLAGLEVGTESAELESSALDDDYLQQWEGLDVISIGFSGVGDVSESFGELEDFSVERIDIEASSVSHPNRKRFVGTLFKIGQPSSGVPVVGSPNPLFVEMETAEILAGAMKGLPINADKSLRKHDKSNPIGVFMDSWVEGDDFKVEGFLWPGTRQETVSLLASTQCDRQLGMSIEAIKLQVEPRMVGGRQVTVLKEIIPTGGAVLLADSATFNNTTFRLEAQALRDVEASAEDNQILHNSTEESMTTDLNEKLVDKTIAAIDALSANTSKGFERFEARFGDFDARFAQLEASVSVIEREREAKDSEAAQQLIEASKRQEREELAQMLRESVATELKAEIAPVVARLDTLEASAIKRKGVVTPPPFNEQVGTGTLEASAVTQRQINISKIQGQIELIEAKNDYSGKAAELGELYDKLNAYIDAR